MLMHANWVSVAYEMHQQEHNNIISTQVGFAIHGLRFSVHGLLVTIVLSVQRDTLQLQSDNQTPWTNCGELVLYIYLFIYIRRFL